MVFKNVNIIFSLSMCKPFMVVISDMYSGLLKKRKKNSSNKYRLFSSKNKNKDSLKRKRNLFQILSQKDKYM